MVGPAYVGPVETRAAGRVGTGCGVALLVGGAIVAGLALTLVVVVAVMLANFDVDVGDDCRGADDRLVRAAAEGDRATVAEELREGADPDRVVGDVSALECAAAAHEGDVVALLLDQGAAPSDAALRAAVGASGGPLDLPRVVASSSPTRADASAEEQQVVRLLLDHGADADGGATGPSPLLYAAWDGQVSVADLLLEHGADPDHGGRVDSVMIMAAQSGFGTDSALPARAQRQLPQVHGTVDNVPPLVGAAWTGDVEIARRLLDAGAEPDLTSDGAFSPMFAAAVRGDRPMVDLLLSRGAAAAPTVRAGVKTPAQAARAAGHPDIADLLDAT